MNGIYEVSTLGNIRNKKNNKMLKPSKNKVNDYLWVCLGSKNKKYIHRLVYDTFVGFKNPKNITNHRNSKKTDNRLVNLEECSYSYNLKYAYENGERKLKPVCQFSLDNKLIKVYKTAKKASIETGILTSSICSCCRGRLFTAGGYIWKYESEVV